MDEQPVNPLPPVVIVLCLIVIGVELTFSAAEAGFVGGRQGIGWRVNALQDYAFSPAVLDWIISRADFAPTLLRRFITYPFVQGSFTAALFGTAMLLALGKFVGDVFHWAALLVVFLGSTIIGAVVFGLVVEGAAPLYGIFTPVYGLIGAFTYITFVSLGAQGQNQLSAFRLIGILLFLQLLFGLLFGSSPVWIAELSGFFAGFGLSVLAAPGGWAALVRKLRQRS